MQTKISIIVHLQKKKRNHFVRLSSLTQSTFPQSSKKAMAYGLPEKCLKNGKNKQMSFLDLIFKAKWCSLFN